MAVQVEVWGDYACFSRPEMKVERVSYDVMTPSAARGLLEAIYWHPGMAWRIDRIHVLNPICTDRQQASPAGKIHFTNIRRNEVKSKVMAGNVRTVMNGGQAELYLCTSQDIQQRAALVLQNVHYVIEAHFEITDRATASDNPGKFQDIMRRRLEKGQCYHQPYFGTREFPAHFRKWEGGEIPAISETRDLGYMLYDMDYSRPQDIQPTFFRAKLENGVMQVAGCEVIR